VIQDVQNVEKIHSEPHPPPTGAIPDFSYEKSVIISIMII